MKAGKAHRVPLSSSALLIVQAMNAQRISKYVFPGARKGTPLSDASLSKALRTAGCENYTVHGFRSTIRDWVSEATDFQTELAEQALAHAVGSQVERAYRRGDALEKRRAMMQVWGIYCGSAKKV